MLCQTVEETGGMEGSQEFPVKLRSANENTILEIRDGPTHFIALSLFLS